MISTSSLKVSDAEKAETCRSSTRAEVAWGQGHDRGVSGSASRSKCSPEFMVGFGSGYSEEIAVEVGSQPDPSNQIAASGPVYSADGE